MEYTGGIDSKELQDNWGWLLALGIILMIFGLIALGSVFITTMASILLFGWLLLFGGIVQFIQSFRVKGGFLLHLLSGILAIIVGLLLITNPTAGAVTITFILAVYFLVSGLFRLITSISVRYPNWGWSFFYGLIIFLLGIFILQRLPVSGLVIIGLFVGIELFLNGLSWVALALAVKK